MVVTVLLLMMIVQHARPRRRGPFTGPLENMFSGLVGPQNRFFVVTPRFPVSRQTRAGLMKKATQRRLQKVDSGAVLFAVILGLHTPPMQTRAGHLKKAAHGPLI